MTRSLVRWLTGWALMVRLLQPLAWVVGFKRTLELELQPQTLHVRRRVQVLGRTLRDSEEFFSFQAIMGAGCTGRYTRWPLLVSVVGACAAVLVAGWLLQEGLQTGDGALLYLAAAVAGGAALLDLLFDTWVGGLRRRVCVHITFAGPVRVQVAGVPDADARRFLQPLAERLNALGPREMQAAEEPSCEDTAVTSSVS